MVKIFDEKQMNLKLQLHLQRKTHLNVLFCLHITQKALQLQFFFLSLRKREKPCNCLYCFGFFCFLSEFLDELAKEFYLHFISLLLVTSEPIPENFIRYTEKKIA